MARNELEYRTVSALDFREGDDEKYPMRGTAATFNDEYPVWDFVERMAKGAFTRSLQENDIRALYAHKPEKVLGRTGNDTVRLEETDKGLDVRIAEPVTAWGKDVLESVKRGDVDEMSIGFMPREERWEKRKDKPDRRTITDADLHEVSIVAWGANNKTSISARAQEERARQLAEPEPEPEPEPEQDDTEVDDFLEKLEAAELSAKLLTR